MECELDWAPGVSLAAGQKGKEPGASTCRSGEVTASQPCGCSARTVPPTAFPVQSTLPPPLICSHLSWAAWWQGLSHSLPSKRTPSLAGEDNWSGNASPHFCLSPSYWVPGRDHSSSATGWGIPLLRLSSIPSPCLPVSPAFSTFPCLQSPPADNSRTQSYWTEAFINHAYIKLAGKTKCWRHKCWLGRHRKYLNQIHMRF